MVDTCSRRSALMGSLFAGLALPFAAPVFGQPSSSAMIDLHVHPELRKFVPSFVAMSSPLNRLSKHDLPGIRTEWDAQAQPFAQDVPVRQIRVPGHGPNPDVEIFVINERTSPPMPCILHMHGGGFVVGSARRSVPELQKICIALNCVAVSVEYRLAPETTYRGSVEDSYTALKWVYRNSESLGVDRNRIAVMGESAGGGHASLLAMAAHDRGEVPIVFQCLTYPMLDDRTGTSKRIPEHMGQLIWTAQSNHFGWSSFLGMEPGSTRSPDTAVPARRESMAGLPPAFIGVGSIDLFCLENIDFARRLNDQGVPAELLVVPGAFHAFDLTPSLVAADFRKARLDALRRALA